LIKRRRVSSYPRRKDELLAPFGEGWVFPRARCGRLWRFRACRCCLGRVSGAWRQGSSGKEESTVLPRNVHTLSRLRAHPACATANAKTSCFRRRVGERPNGASLAIPYELTYSFKQLRLRSLADPSPETANGSESFLFIMVLTAIAHSSRKS
jgi:hypothetical protein